MLQDKATKYKQRRRMAVLTRIKCSLFIPLLITFIIVLLLTTMKPRKRSTIADFGEKSKIPVLIVSQMKNLLKYGDQNFMVHIK